MKPITLLVPALLVLAGCDKPAEVTVVVPPASQASASTAAASAATPIIPPAPAASMPSEQQRQQGAQLAAQGGNGAAACTGCHGAQGEGNPAAGFPRIAGQSYDYLRRQLASYANDSRNHPVMAPIAKALSPAQQEAAAAYYASLASPPAAAAAAASAVNARGQQLAGIGDEQKGVQACANCHGPQGIGQGSAYPYLAGQPQAFLVAALTAWRDGTRRNDPSGQMPQIAKSLVDADVQAVAAFYAQLPPPSVPRDADLARSGAATTTTPAVVSGPRGGGQPGQGVGTEQGAPVTGGGQGPGGGGATGANSTGGAPASAASR